MFGNPAFVRLMQEDYINGGQTGLHSESLSQTKQKCIFLKGIHFICVCEYEHIEDLNSVHRACMMSSFISLSQLSSLQVILKRKNNVFHLFEGRERDRESTDDFMGTAHNLCSGLKV